MASRRELGKKRYKAYPSLHGLAYPYCQFRIDGGNNEKETLEGGGLLNRGIDNCLCSTLAEV
jgi:hypothetical protein